MAQSDALQQAAARLHEAVEALETSLDQLLAASDPIEALSEQVRSLTSERDRLLAELETERKRARRLEAANDEVSDRLQSLMGTLKEMVPSSGAGLEL